MALAPDDTDAPPFVWPPPQWSVQAPEGPILPPVGQPPLNPPPPPPPQRFDRGAQPPDETPGARPSLDQTVQGEGEQTPSGGPSIADAAPHVSDTIGAIGRAIDAPFSSFSTEAAKIDPMASAPNVADSVAADTEPGAPPMPGTELPSEAGKREDAEDAALTEKLRRDPIALNKYLVDQAKRRNDAQSALEAKANAKDREDALRNHQMMDKAVQDSLAHSAILDQQAKELAHTRINSQFHGGLMRGIGAAIASALGGAMSQYTGGKNLALEGIKDHIDRDIAAQKDDLANRWKGIADERNTIANDYAKHGDLYQAQEKFRLASLDATRREIQTTMQNFDPRGTSVAALAQLDQQTDATRSQALQAYHQQDLNNRINVAKVQNEYTKQLADEAQKKVENQLKGQEIGARYAEMANQRTLKRMEIDAKDQERIDKQASNVIQGLPLGSDADGRVIYGALPQPDGKGGTKPFVPLNEEDAKQLKKMTPAVNEVNRLANQMARDIADLGVMDKSSTLATAKHQRLMADKEALIFALHGAKGIEGFRPGTAELLEQLLGGVSPDKWGRDATAGILRARDNVNADYTGVLHGAGWKGQRYEPPDTSSFGAPIDVGDEATVKNLIAPVDKEHYDDMGRSHLLPSDMAQIATWGVQVAESKGASDPAARRAADALENVANNSKVPEIREYASRILARGALTLGSPLESDEPKQSTSRDDAAPPVPKGGK